MKINIGIVGYGNLGKSAEQIVLSRHDLNLVAIFSRRVVKSRYNSLVESYENISLYKNRIDVMLLCGGSFDDLEKQTWDTLLYFDCINTFDNHKKLFDEKIRLDNLAKNSKHRLIMACGWDPGIFSMMRAMMFAFSGAPPSVFWGKGISMGHSDAIRKVPQVLDGIEFTVPNTEAVKLARKGKLSGDETLHFRECFVVAEKKHQKKISDRIKNIPDYFKGQPTIVNFVSQEKLLKLKSNFSHKGEVISAFKTISGDKCYFDFKLKTKSNPSFTATIMTKYIDAILAFKNSKLYGAFTPIDIPISYLFKPDIYDKIIKEFC